MSVSGRYIAPPAVMSDRTDLKDMVATQRTLAGVNGKSAAPVSKPAETVPASAKTVEETVKEAEKKLASGPMTTPGDALDAMNLVKALPPEKQGEALEKLDKKGVNITNEVDVRADGRKVVWEKDELEAVDRTFTNTPKEHLTKVNEFRREDAHPEDGRQAEHEPGDGTIRMFDNGARRDKHGQLTHHKDKDGTVSGTRELTTPEMVSKGGAQALSTG